MAPSSARIAVIGAGIAGSALARALHDQGADVVLVDPGGPRASDVPVAICQPVMGRRAGVSTIRLRGFRSAQQWLGPLLQAHPHLRRARGLLRIATNDRRAADYERRGGDWPPDVARLLDANACTARVPGLTGVRCGIWVPDALAVDLPGVVNVLARGVPRIRRGVRELASRREGVYLVDHAGMRLRVDRVVVAAGIGAPALLAPWGVTERFRSELHGEVLTLASTTPPPVMVGETGQIVPLGGDRVAVTASQREGGVPGAHAGVEQLQTRAASAWSALEGARVLGVWSGRRMTTRDAHPLVGPVSEDERVWSLAGMGSRGVLYGLHAAGLVAAGLLEDGEQEPLWDPHRGPKTTNPHSGG